MKSRKHTKNKHSEVVRTKSERIMLLSKCAVCDSAKLKFIKEASYLLSSWETKNPLSKIPLVGPIVL